MQIHCVTMIRNENDIVDASISHSRKLFDSHSFVDMQSVDGTREALARAARETPSICVFDFRTQAKYQSEIGVALVKEHVAAGADWVFLIDADEFLRVNSRAELERALDEFETDVMYLPWINLIPSKFGTYEHFSFEQEFRWTGRVSSFRKVALSARFVATNPAFHIEMGNHAVKCDCNGPTVSETLGLSMIHLPIRSSERLNYKSQREVQILKNKANGGSFDGFHAQEIVARTTNRTLSDGRLRALSKNYGVDFDCDDIEGEGLKNWPVLKLPDYLIKIAPSETKRLGLTEVLGHDAKLQWKRHTLIKGSKVKAHRREGEILVTCQPIRGDGSCVQDNYVKLDDRDVAEMHFPSDMSKSIDLITAAFISPRVYEFSAWSELIPVLSAILAIAKPRRFVELGVHNGMSFLAACNTVERLELNTECIAIDSWIGDEHAGFHDPTVFETFKRNIGNLFPKQQYIRGYFRDAAECFQDGSIDLLHIDGFHTYDAVKNDFDTWLPKMTDTGLIMFHDTNVYRKDFGVWRFWDEVSAIYPNFNFQHSHGLGLAYVGQRESPIKAALAVLNKDKNLAKVVQTSFTALGELMVEALKYKFEHEMASAKMPARNAPTMIGFASADSALRSILEDKWWRRTRPFRKATNKLRKLRGRPQKSWPDLTPI
jgi:hypothetical protein